MFNLSLTWDEYKSAFEWEGHYRDIYVLETDIKHWKTLLEYLAEGHYPLKYSVNDVELPLDTNAWQIFRLWKTDKRANMSIDVSGIVVNCHFFDQNEIEFDIDPREVTDESKALAIFEFMSQIGAELQKDVFLTEENAQEDAWFTYEVATGEIVFCELY